MSFAPRLSLTHPRSIPRQRTAPPSVLSCARESFTVAGSPTAALFMTGEIDVCTCARLAEALLALRAQPSSNIVVDLTGVGFCSVSGVALLLDDARAAAAQGRRFDVVSGPTQLTRVCALLWPGHRLARHPTFAAAVAAISAAQR